MRSDTGVQEHDKGLQTWDPFREFRLPSFMGGLFEDFLAPLPAALPASAKTWLPRVDIQETDKDFVLTIPLAGVRKEDVKVAVKDDVLTISGERRQEKEEKGKSWLRRETSYGAFQRRFVVPADTHPEDVHASFKEGVLTVSLRKPAPGKSRGVDIKVD